MSDETPRALDHDDEMVDEAGRESFPASDPPAFTSGVADVQRSVRSGGTAAEDCRDAAGGETCRPDKKGDKKDDKKDDKRSR